jgi:hypothetical protein
MAALMDERQAEQLERLVALEQIRATVVRYTDIVDRTHDLDELRALLRADAVLRNPREYHDADAIVEYYGNHFANNPAMSRHHVTNQLIEFDGPDRARLRAYFLLLTARDGESIVAFGNYADVLERDAGGWRYAVKGNEVLHFGPLAQGWAG